MKRPMLKFKIHRATVTDVAELADHQPVVVHVDGRNRPSTPAPAAR